VDDSWFSLELVTEGDTVTVGGIAYDLSTDEGQSAFIEAVTALTIAS
jgi:hypothetical protein